MNIAWKTIDSEQLLAMIPDNEDNRWEYKAVGLLEDENKFKSKLGKQVSAFANSLGGFIILGVKDDRSVGQPFPDQKGETRMKDWLAKVVSYSVESPLQDFQVHRVPITGQSGAIYVIEVGDSVAAPHQAKDKVYYYRIDGHSDPAPHVHLQLLRDRYTRSVLQVIDIGHTVDKVALIGGTLILSLAISFRNISKQATTAWGVFLKSDRQLWRTDQGPIDEEGVWVQGTGSSQVVFPGEPRTVFVTIRAEAGPGEKDDLKRFVMLWENFDMTIQVVSQNAISAEHHIGKWEPRERSFQGIEFKKMIETVMRHTL